MIASISKQLVVVIAIVGAALPALVSAELVGERKFYFDATYSVSDCPRPQIRQRIDSPSGTRTSACGEYLNKEFLNINSKVSATKVERRVARVADDAEREIFGNLRKSVCCIRKKFK